MRFSPPRRGFENAGAAGAAIASLKVKRTPARVVMP